MDQNAIDAILASVDYTIVIGGIAGIGAAVAVLLVSQRGLKAMLGALKGN